MFSHVCLIIKKVSHPNNWVRVQWQHDRCSLVLMYLPSCSLNKILHSWVNCRIRFGLNSLAISASTLIFWRFNLVLVEISHLLRNASSTSWLRLNNLLFHLFFFSMTILILHLFFFWMVQHLLLLLFCLFFFFSIFFIEMCLFFSKYKSTESTRSVFH